MSFASFVKDLTPSDPNFIHRSSHLKQMHTKDDKIRVMPIFAYGKSLDF
ncbi:hypothetical protein [Holospora curviuscula]